MATVAEPCAMRSPEEITKAERMIGQPSELSEPATASPMPVAESTAPKNAPDPITSSSIPTGFSALEMIEAMSEEERPRRSPSHMDNSTASVSAMAGVPTRVSRFRSGPSESRMFPKVPPRISSRGRPITRATTPMLGGVRSSASSWSFAEVAGMKECTRLSIQMPHSRPETMNAGMPTAKPISSTQPRSTPNRPAAATGPGRGGRKAWVTDRPASSGIAYLTSDPPPCRAAT
jgi:hypothetical protein